LFAADPIVRVLRARDFDLSTAAAAFVVVVVVVDDLQISGRR